MLLYSCRISGWNHWNSSKLFFALPRSTPSTPEAVPTSFLWVPPPLLLPPNDKAGAAAGRAIAHMIAANRTHMVVERTLPVRSERPTLAHAIAAGALEGSRDSVKLG